jgi:hypothetical protein
MSTQTPLIEKFESIFIRYLKKGLQPGDAYEKAESEFVDEHKTRKYANYNSFQTARSKRPRK